MTRAVGTMTEGQPRIPRAAARPSAETAPGHARASAAATARGVGRSAAYAVEAPISLYDCVWKPPPDTAATSDWNVAENGVVPAAEERVVVVRDGATNRCVCVCV